MNIVTRSLAVLGLIACAACTVNTPSQPTPVVVQQPSPTVTTVPSGGAVILQRP